MLYHTKGARMLDFSKLLSYGYFPPELPPCFTTEQFGSESEFIKTLINDESLWNKNTRASIPLSFSGYKSDNSRRKFAVANPAQFAKAAYLVSENSEELFKAFNKSSIAY